MYIIVWLGETFFLVLATAIVGFVTLLLWMVAKWWASWWAAGQEPGVQATDILNVRNLSSELTTITNWYQLGLNLNLQTHVLDKIQQDHAHQGNDRQMLVMLGLWLRCTPNATWEDVVSALQKMGENRVAENVRQKHNRRASTCK